MHNYTTVDTAFGPCALAFGTEGLAALELPVDRWEPRAAVAARIEARGAQPGRASAGTRRVARRLTAFLAGSDDDFADLSLDLQALPPFHQRAYRALRTTGKGEVITYRDLAVRLGQPGAMRAVAQAMAKNPLPIVVPCHRVVASGGGLGGFSAAGGSATKARLLVFEGARRPEEILARADPTLGRLMKRVGPFSPGPRRSGTIFYSLARSIAYQQLAGKAAETIWGRVEALYPRPKGVTPEAVQKTAPERLRAAGLSGAKTAAILDLAAKAISGVVANEATLQRLADAEIVARLTTVRGIGPWSVEMLLMFRLGRLDVLPASDYGVRKGFQLVYRRAEPPTPGELLAYGERWRPFRSIASWYMWRALEQAKPAK